MLEFAALIFILMTLPFWLPLVGYIIMLALAGLAIAWVWSHIGAWTLVILLMGWMFLDESV